MPPRIPIPSFVRSQSSCSTTVTHPRLFSISSSVQAKKRSGRRSNDQYSAEYRKNANIARQAVLKKARADSLGDPVVGIPTPFVESFDTAQTPADTDATATQPDYMRPNSKPTAEPQILNHFVHKEEVDPSTWDKFRESTRPVQPPPPGKLPTIMHDRIVSQEVLDEVFYARRARHVQDDARAREAAARILALDKTGNHKQIYRVNVQRCIEKFGRHNTDQTLKPQPHKDQDAPPPVDTRGGPDTGSSEVQVAILTAKIRTLHAMMQKTNQDKHNKRNLRLLVHRRQKLLAYLRRKEKGGPRWRHLMETLGLTDGSWKGEITM